MTTKTQDNLRQEALQAARDSLKEREDYQTAVWVILNEHVDFLLYYPESEREARAEGVVHLAEWQLGFSRT